MIETRVGISGFYKGLIYCSSLLEAQDVQTIVDHVMHNTIRFDLNSKIKRGCSEYALEYPKYKDVNISGSQSMNYNQEWKIHENRLDSEYRDWGCLPS